MLDFLRLLLAIMDKVTLALVGWRMRVAVHVGHEKRRLGLPVHQPQQWDAVRLRLDKAGHFAGLSSRFIDSYSAALHQESLLRQYQTQPTTTAPQS
jgi:chorismate mutase